MKRALLVTLDFPPRVGGVSSYYHNLCSRLPPKSIAVLAPPQPSAQEFDVRQTYPIIRLPLLDQRRWVWPRWKNLHRVMAGVVAEQKADLILVGNILPIGTAALLLKAMNKTPYAVFTHGLDVTSLRGRKKVMARTICKNAAHIFSNSHYTKHRVEELGVDYKKITTVYPSPEVLPNASDVEMMQLKNQHDWQNKKILLTVGRLVKRKGHDKVIAALPRILKEVSNAVYVIAGDGPELSALQKKVRTLRLENSVDFVRQPSPQQLSALYEICDVFIMPSRQLANGDVEGFGMVFLEANLFGKPVIGGASGGMAEAVEHEKTGLLVDPENIEDISAAVIRLFKDIPMSHRLGMQGMSRVHERFEWGQQAHILHRAIESLFSF